jgi:hypothetical protein
VLISLFVIIILASMALSTLPPSRLDDVTQPYRRPITDVTGLFQSWELFAPNPRSSTLQLEARLTYDDGATATWRPPRGDRVIGVYRTFRWRKWANNVLVGDKTRLHRAAALFIASRNPRDGEYPVEVTLVRLSYSAPPPGSGQARDHDPEWDEDVYYTLLLSTDGRPVGADR